MLKVKPKINTNHELNDFFNHLRVNRVNRSGNQSHRVVADPTNFKEDMMYIVDGDNRVVHTGGKRSDLDKFFRRFPCCSECIVKMMCVFEDRYWIRVLKPCNKFEASRRNPK